MSPPRIAIIGSGKMGRAVAQLAAERGWPVVATIDGRENAGAAATTADRLQRADVAVEFTEPSAAAANIIACARAGCPVVCGTTGWTAERPRVEAEVRALGGALFHAANFSIGVNLFWEMARDAARRVAQLGSAGIGASFDAHIIETHHSAKKDAPSGTALEMERRVAAELGHDVPVTSVRLGSVPGTHELLFDGAFEQLTLRHVARDRRVFADGALTAARWLIGRQGVFTMNDLLAAPPAGGPLTPGGSP